MAVAGANRDAHRKPQLDHERQQLDAELEQQQCQQLLRLGLVVGQQGDEWFAVDRSADEFEGLHADLHWNGRQHITLRDSECQRHSARADSHAFGESHFSRERRLDLP